MYFVYARLYICCDVQLDAESVAWLEQFLSDFKGTVVAITHDRYFLENSCSWILELDRGEGIPFEGNYSGWLEKKQQRFEEQKRQDERLKKTISSELEWVRSNPKARQAKSKARLNRYEELLATPAREVANSGAIYIPPGPRLGDVVIEAKGVTKAFGDRMLIKDLSFELPPGAIVGVIGKLCQGQRTLPLHHHSLLLLQLQLLPHHHHFWIRTIHILNTKYTVVLVLI